MGDRHGHLGRRHATDSCFSVFFLRCLLCVCLCALRSLPTVDCRVTWWYASFFWSAVWDKRAYRLSSARRWKFGGGVIRVQSTHLRDTPCISVLWFILENHHYGGNNLIFKGQSTLFHIFVEKYMLMVIVSEMRPKPSSFPLKHLWSPVPGSWSDDPSIHPFRFYRRLWQYVMCFGPFFVFS